MDTISEALDQAINKFNGLKEVEAQGLFEFAHPLLLAETLTVIKKLPKDGTYRYCCWNFATCHPSSWLQSYNY